MANGKDIMILFLIIGAILVMVACGYTNTQKHLQPVKNLALQRHVPTAVEMLMVTVEAGQMVHVIEHTSFITITTALILLAIVVATRQEQKSIHTSSPKPEAV